MNSRNQISVRVDNYMLNVEVINFHTPWSNVTSINNENVLLLLSKDLYFYWTYENTCFLHILPATSHMYINVCSCVGAYFLLLFCILPFFCVRVNSISDLIYFEILIFHFKSVKIISHYPFYFSLIHKDEMLSLIYKYQDIVF